MKNYLLSFVALVTILIGLCSYKSEYYDPILVDNTGKDAAAVDTLKVMSYNIHHCNPPSMQDSIDINAIVNVIRSENPDLLAIQEVDVNTKRSGVLNQAAAIANKLNMYYFFAKSIDYQGGEYGVAIISKYTLNETVVYHLPTKAGTNGEPRVLATAKIILPNGAAVRFGCTHLDAQSDETNRQLQIEKIGEIASSELLPFVIAGDFNATPGSNIINSLDRYFKRTCQSCDYTIPAVNPTKAIDFIAYHPENKFNVINHKVVSEQYASDHRPVVALMTVDMKTSIINVKNIKLMVYPNPATDIFSIEGNCIIDHVDIIDLFGKIVLSVSKPKVSISLNGIYNGIYLLRIFTSEGVVIKKICIKP